MRRRLPPAEAEPEDRQKPIRPLFWVGSSRRDLTEMPEDVKDMFGYGLFLAQRGEKDGSAKPLAGFGGAGVLELIDSYDGDAYRAVYTVKFSTGVYVLHAFQKKSKSGIATPAREMETVRDRLRSAAELHEYLVNQPQKGQENG